jgi:peptidoglycan/LPS O-acetylase OafA/YrhL
MAKLNTMRNGGQIAGRSGGPGDDVMSEPGEWRGQLVRHADPLTMLRGILALAVIWHHLQSEPIASMTLGGKNVFFLISFPGRISVWLFMVISGYSIYHGYRKVKYDFGLQDTLRFYFNRAVRILPLFYVTVILKWIVLVYLSATDLPRPGEIVRTLFFIDFNMLDGIYTFTPTWVIAIIAQFYLIAPLLAKGYRAALSWFDPRLQLLILIAIAVICHFLGRQMTTTYDIRNIVGCLPLFLFGFFACDLHHGHRKELAAFSRKIPSIVIYLILIVLFELAFFLYQYRFDTFLELPMEAYTGILGVALIGLLPSDAFQARKTHPTGSSLAVRWAKQFLSSAGKQSYGLYMWHGIIIALVIRTGFLPLGDFPHPTFGSLVQTFLVVSILTYIVSVIFYHILERPYHLLYRDARR